MAELRSVDWFCCECEQLQYERWETFVDNFWTEVESCECCGTSVVLWVEVTCRTCGRHESLRLRG